MNTDGILAITLPLAAGLTAGAAILHRGLDKLAERGAKVTISFGQLTFQAAKPAPAAQATSEPVVLPPWSFKSEPAPAKDT